MNNFLFDLFLPTLRKSFIFLFLCLLLLTKLRFQNRLNVGLQRPFTCRSLKLPSNLGLYGIFLKGTTLVLECVFSDASVGFEELVPSKGISGFLSGSSICIRETWCGLTTLIGCPPIAPLGAVTSGFWLARF